MGVNEKVQKLYANLTWHRQGRLLQAFRGKEWVGEIGQMQQCRRWIVWMTDDEGCTNDPDGEKFLTQWEAKRHLAFLLFHRKAP